MPSGRFPSVPDMTLKILLQIKYKMISIDVIADVCLYKNDEFSVIDYVFTRSLFVKSANVIIGLVNRYQNLRMEI